MAATNKRRQRITHASLEILETIGIDRLVYAFIMALAVFVTFEALAQELPLKLDTKWTGQSMVSSVEAAIKRRKIVVGTLDTMKGFIVMRAKLSGDVLPFDVKTIVLHADCGGSECASGVTAGYLQIQAVPLTTDGMGTIQNPSDELHKNLSRLFVMVSPELRVRLGLVRADDPNDHSDRMLVEITPSIGVGAGYAKDQNGTTTFVGVKPGMGFNAYIPISANGSLFSSGKVYYLPKVSKNLDSAISAHGEVGYRYKTKAGEVFFVEGQFNYDRLNAKILDDVDKLETNTNNVLFTGASVGIEF
jgi:hypothetical protein